MSVGIVIGVGEASYRGVHRHRVEQRVWVAALDYVGVVVGVFAAVGDDLVDHVDVQQGIGDVERHRRGIRRAVVIHHDGVVDGIAYLGQLVTCLYHVYGGLEQVDVMSVGIVIGVGESGSGGEGQRGGVGG